MKQYTLSIAKNLFNGIKRKTPDGKRKIEATVRPVTGSWPGMVKSFKKLHVVDDKKKAPYIVFATFKEQAENGEYHRRNTNVNEFYGTVLDVDSGPYDFDSIREVLEGRGFNYALYSTYSYDPWDVEKENKFRIVIPYAETIAPEQQPLTVVGLASMLGLDEDFDNCSKTLTQPMYLHASPPDRADAALFAARINGHFVDPHEASELGRMVAGTGMYAGKTRTPLPQAGDDIDAGDRHDIFKRKLAQLKNQGKSLEDAMGDIILWNSKLSNPLPDDQVQGLRRVWQTFQTNGNAFGFEEHRLRIKSVPMQNHDTYTSVMQHIADSREKLDAAEIRELFLLIKDNRPGSTLKTIEEHYKTLCKDAEIEDAEEIGALMDRFGKRLKKALKGYVWLTHAGVAYHVPKNKVIKKEAFQSELTNLWGSLRYEFHQLAVLYKGVPLTLNNVLMENWIEVFQDVVYMPGEGEIIRDAGCNWRNLYIDPGHQFGDGENSGPLLEYFNYLFPEPDDRELMLNFIAGLVQRPGEKIRYAPIIFTAQQQIGKDFLKENLLKPLLGRNNIGEVTADYVREKYTEDLSEKQLILLQELDYGRNKHVAEATAGKMKPFITNTEVQVRRFGRPGGVIPHCAAYIGFTNYYDAVFLEGSNARYYMIEGPNHRKPPEWYDRIADYLENHIDDCYEYFANRDISGFSFRNMPRNRRTEEMRKDSVGWPMNVINPALDNGELEGITHLPMLHVGTLLSKLSDIDDFDKVESFNKRGKAAFQKRIVAGMKAFGFNTVRTRNERGLLFPTPHDKKKRNWQKVLTLPGVDPVETEDLITLCHDSVKMLARLQVDDTSAPDCLEDDELGL